MLCYRSLKEMKLLILAFSSRLMNLESLLCLVFVVKLLILGCLYLTLPLNWLVHHLSKNCEVRLCHKHSWFTRESMFLIMVFVTVLAPIKGRSLSLSLSRSVCRTKVWTRRCHSVYPQSLSLLWPPVLLIYLWIILGLLCKLFGLLPEIWDRHCQRKRPHSLFRAGFSSAWTL